jgi:hypothetical protein
MSELKTRPNDASVTDFLNSVENDTRKQDSFTLLKMFTEITGEKPKLWGTSIVGFGMYHFKSERSSQEGDWPLIGFSPRKQNLTLYVAMDFAGFDDLHKKLGKSTTSKACLYINKLADVDQQVLEEIIKQSFAVAKDRFPSN